MKRKFVLFTVIIFSLLVLFAGCDNPAGGGRGGSPSGVPSGGSNENPSYESIVAGTYFSDSESYKFNANKTGVKNPSSGNVRAVADGAFNWKIDSKSGNTYAATITQGGNSEQITFYANQNTVSISGVIYTKDVTGGDYTPPQVDNNPIVCAPGTHLWAFEYIGPRELNGEQWKHHRLFCKLCSYEEIKVCNNSISCSDCKHKTSASENGSYDSYDSSAQFIKINENIKTIVIVANKGFENSNPLKKYIEHKQSKNFEIVEKYYPTRTTAESIRSDLKTIYQEQQNENKNMCVLIVGRGGGEYQAYGIPEFVNKNQWQGRAAATDFWYGYYGDSTTNLFPDVMVGRLSAKNVSELAAQVDKIIAMETIPRTENKNIVLVQQVVNDNETPFHDEVVDLTNYFKTKKPNYTVKEVRTTNLGDINSAINDGASLVSYTGHGGTTYWGSYNVSYVSQLRNSNYPVISGVTCHSANYTDGDACLAEAFMRKANGGAVGYIGASQAMIAYYSKVATAGNDKVPGMVGSLYWSNKYEEKYGVKTLGGMFLAALRSIKMSKTFVSQQAKDYSIEVLNLFGDPTYKPYTDTP